jgi:hypothetical protein
MFRHILVYKVSGQFFNQSFCGIDCEKMDLKTFMMDYFTAQRLHIIQASIKSADNRRKQRDH